MFKLTITVSGTSPESPFAPALQDINGAIERASQSTGTSPKQKTVYISKKEQVVYLRTETEKLRKTAEILEDAVDSLEDKAGSLGPASGDTER
ncbi:MAG: hypothetical protein GF401_04775 [Chitinivibrionales bacterium]|nr:hypothetical protein [Chitinivibrionales bacterium]